MSDSQYPLYAAIDLGSNSFHMLIIRSIGGGVQTIGKIKRKVRLAAGLDDNNKLDQAAMARGWDCLSLFAERLQDLPTENVKIVATAALRLAKNRETFLSKAEQILGHRINIISGEDEAKLIYQGVAHTSGTSATKLVIDIGGASTELVCGEYFEPKVVNSLNIGCVTFKNRFFNDGRISHRAFELAIEEAQHALTGKIQPYMAHGWDACLGASGTPQAIQECMIAQGENEMITLPKLEALMRQAIGYGDIEQLNIEGLSQERKPVFVPGLAILIALFRALHVSYMVVAGGALREGLIYGMLPDDQLDIRQRTANSFIQRYHLDGGHAKRVRDTAIGLYQQVIVHWSLRQHDADAILEMAALLHEVGLTVDFKQANKHAAYILNNTSIPGFSLAQRKLLICLVRNYREDIVESELHKQTMTSPLLAQQLTCLLRLSVLLAMRRQDEVLPKVKVLSKGAKDIHLDFEQDWLDSHPLMESELLQERNYLEKIGWQLSFSQ